MHEFIKYAKNIQAVGVIVGFPVIIAVGIFFYERQIDNLKSENELLKQTQYDKALSTIKSQRELFENERKKYETKIEKLTKDSSSNQKEIDDLKSKIFALNKSEALLTKQLLKSQEKAFKNERKKYEATIEKLTKDSSNNQKKIDDLKAKLNGLNESETFIKKELLGMLNTFPFMISTVVYNRSEKDSIKIAKKIAEKEAWHIIKNGVPVHIETIKTFKKNVIIEEIITAFQAFNYEISDKKVNKLDDGGIAVILLGNVKFGKTVVKNGRLLEENKESFKNILPIFKNKFNYFFK